MHEGARGIVAGFGPGITAEITLGSWASAIPAALAQFACQTLTQKDAML
jgi:1,3,6,8-tetrahydroxynaphthalene synthase